MIDKILINRNNLKEHIFININLSQSIEDIGTFTDVPFLASNGPLPIRNKFVRQPNTRLQDYFDSYRKDIKATSSSYLSMFQRYGNTPSYTTKMVRDTGFSNNSNGISYQWFNVFNSRKLSEEDTRVIHLSYTLDGPEYVDDNSYPNYGIRYNEIQFDGSPIEVTSNYKSSGHNYTNSSISAIIKEEYLMGIVDIIPPENTTPVDRGAGQSVLEGIQRLSEINNIGQLEKYGKGYFKIIT